MIFRRKQQKLPPSKADPCPPPLQPPPGELADEHIEADLTEGDEGGGGGGWLGNEEGKKRR